ncbi:MAG: 23S rRNA (guanosine(2251)-2'-O)-methyltransferase RlmB [Kordiimonadales bacterium]|nr:MAG: 23S rRNA (guanosine(2251)-2'-O)-methyltransferase RlmB [Kordiimonadales bacterium]
MARTRKPPRKPRVTSGKSNGYERTATRGPSERAPQQRPAKKEARPSERSPAERSRRPSKPSTALKPSYAGAYFLYGRNSVEAALQNKRRECLRLIGTEKSLSDESIAGIRPDIKTVTIEHIEEIADAVPDGAPHQGILLEVRFLPGLHIADLEPIEGQKNIILMLDQVTDPQNVGACIRSAAAFGARAIITQDRNSPVESGSLARAAAGGLEVLPWLQMPNLSQALTQLKEMGYWHIGLDGDADLSIKKVSLGENIVIVMGSEGRGLRPLVRKNCDVIANIPMSGSVESLNVSNAAAITLFQLTE